jgi:GNAT superfamily N-acetyltransferase
MPLDPDLTFRDATPADIPAILTLAHAGDARGPDTPPLDPNTFGDPRYLAALAEISASPAQRIVVAERGGEVVGTIQISAIPGLVGFGMRRGQLENVHVRADMRGRGIGSQMVRWAIERCREMGCGVVQLTSNKRRTDAHRFYARLGFVASHEGFKLYFDR